MTNLLKMNRNGNKKYGHKYMFNILVTFKNNIQHLMVKIKVRNYWVFSIHLAELYPHSQMEESSFFLLLTLSFTWFPIEVVNHWCFDYLFWKKHNPIFYDFAFQTNIISDITYFISISENWMFGIFNITEKVI